MTRFAAMLPLTLLLAATGSSDYPEGFRRWHFVKAAAILPGSPAFAHFGGVHVIYANDAALKGYSSGSFDPGARIVFDVFDANLADNLVDPTARRIVDVMTWVTGPDGKGAWEFTEYDRDRRLTIDAAAGQKQCSACHAGAPGGVFSKVMG